MFHLSNGFASTCFHQQSKGTPFRLPQDHQLFECLTQAIADGKEKVKGITCHRTLDIVFFFFSPCLPPLPLNHLLWGDSPGVVMEDPHWQSFMEQAVRLIYFLAESPDQLCSRLLQRSTRLLLDQIAEGGDINKDASQAEDGSHEPCESGEQGAYSRDVV